VLSALGINSGTINDDDNREVKEDRGHETSLGLVINKYVFRRLVQQLVDQMDCTNFEFEPESIVALQSATEDFLMMLFQGANAHRHTQSMYISNTCMPWSRF
jgi:histone H3/H4